MKDRTIEEKARRYDELIAKLIKAKEDDAFNDERYCCVIDEIVPELKESEHKRMIRKLKSCVYSADLTIEGRNELIAWLGKQVEQKPNPCDGCINRKGCIRCENGELKETEQNSNTIKPKFKVGDWIVFAENHNSIYQVERIDNYRYYMRHYLGGTLSAHFDNKLIRLWTINDAKDGDVLYCKNNGIEYIVMNKGINESGNIDSYFRYNSFSGFDIDVPSVLSAACDNITPATKEQCDTLFAKMKEAGYEWDKEKKELKKIEQKLADKVEPKNTPQLTEEDIRIIHNLLGEVSFENAVKGSDDNIHRETLKRFNEIKNKQHENV